MITYTKTMVWYTANEISNLYIEKEGNTWLVVFCGRTIATKKTLKEAKKFVDGRYEYAA